MERIVVTVIAVTLIILDANNYIKVPEQAILLLNGLYVVGDAAVRSAKAMAIAKVAGSPVIDVSPSSEIGVNAQSEKDDKIRTIRKL